jgi:hypothetical protein
MTSETWRNVQIQERDLHVGCIYKAPNFYGMCDLCSEDSASFKIWRTSIDTNTEYTHNICHQCAVTASETFGVAIDRMVNTGLKQPKPKEEVLET